MDNLIFYSLGFLIFLPILIGYYFDYKSDPKEFKLSLKSLWNKRSSKALLYLIIYFSLVKVYEYGIPLNKNNGIEFNSTREKIGIPIIGNNWKTKESRFRILWWKTDSTDGHFKKIIEYGILNAKTEIDFYEIKNQKETFAWSVYNYENNTFDYYIEKPNEKIVSVSEKGSLKYENPTIETKVNKIEFEKYITK